MADSKQNGGKSKGKGANKNQTATARAEQRKSEALHPTKHTCASSQCDRPGQRVALGELQTVVALIGTGKKRTRHYHSACYSKHGL